MYTEDIQDAFWGVVRVYHNMDLVSIGSGTPPPPSDYCGIWTTVEQHVAAPRCAALSWGPGAYTGCDPTLVEPYNVYDSYSLKLTNCCFISIANFGGTGFIGNSNVFSGSISDLNDVPIMWNISISGKYYSGEGRSPSAVWDGKDINGNIVPAGTYTATLYARTGGCNVSKSINIKVTTACDIEITSLNSSKQTINPFSGEYVAIGGNIADSSGQSINWNAVVADRKFNGTGKTPSFTWDCKDNAGHTVPDGTYQITLVAKTADGTCTDTKTVSVTVKSICSLSISSLSASKQTINPSSGENTSISGSITDSSSLAITWTLNVGGQTFTGSGTFGKCHMGRQRRQR